MKNEYFRNKVIIITGARQGIGRALSIKLSDCGAKLAINSRDAGKLSDLKEILTQKGCDVTDIPGDISDEKACRQVVQKTLEKYGRIDILINNAGIAGAGTVEESDSSVFEKQIEVNLLAPYYMTKHALPYLRETKGNILFVSSLAGLFGLPSYSGYSVSKMGLTALVQSLKSELHGQNVHVGIAYVGFTENDPQKTQYNPKGELVPLPDRKVRRVSAEKTASLILSQIKRRRFKSVHSFLGKAEYHISKFFPGLIEAVLRRAGAEDRIAGK